MVLRRSARRTALKNAPGKNPAERAHEEAIAKKRTTMLLRMLPWMPPLRKSARESSTEKTRTKKPMGIVHAKNFTENVSKKEPMVKVLPETMQTKPCEGCYAKKPRRKTARIKLLRECSWKSPLQKKAQYKGSTTERTKRAPAKVPKEFSLAKNSTEKARKKVHQIKFRERPHLKRTCEKLHGNRPCKRTRGRSPREKAQGNISVEDRVDKES